MYICIYRERERESETERERASVYYSTTMHVASVARDTTRTQSLHWNWNEMSITLNPLPAWMMHWYLQLRVGLAGLVSPITCFTWEKERARHGIFACATPATIPTHQHIHTPTPTTLCRYTLQFLKDQSRLLTTPYNSSSKKGFLLGGAWPISWRKRRRRKPIILPMLHGLQTWVKILLSATRSTAPQTPLQ